MKLFRPDDPLQKKARRRGSRTRAAGGGGVGGVGNQDQDLGEVVEHLESAAAVGVEQDSELAHAAEPRRDGVLACYRDAIVMDRSARGI